MFVQMSAGMAPGFAPDSDEEGGSSQTVRRRRSTSSSKQRSEDNIDDSEDTQSRPKNSVLAAALKKKYSADGTLTQNISDDRNLTDSDIENGRHTSAAVMDIGMYDFDGESDPDESRAKSEQNNGYDDDSNGGSSEEEGDGGLWESSVMLPTDEKDIDLDVSDLSTY